MVTLSAKTNTLITTLRTPWASARQHQQHNLVRDLCMVPSDRQDQRETTRTRNEGAKYGEIRDYKLMALELLICLTYHYRMYLSNFSWISQISNQRIYQKARRRYLWCKHKKLLLFSNYEYHNCGNLQQKATR